MKKILPFLSLIFLFAGCQEEAPDNPEGVIRLWQQYMDRNDFEAAKELSTPQGQQVITDIEELLSFDGEPIPVDTTDFIAMACVENGNQAVCRYTERMKEEYFQRGNERIKVEEEIISDSFLLKKIKGKWLVDLPDDPIPNDEELQEMFNELLEEEKENF